MVGRRRAVMVGGRRVKTIDVHPHCVIPEAYALLGLKVDEHRGPGIESIGGIKGPVDGTAALGTPPPPPTAAPQRE